MWAVFIYIEREIVGREMGRFFFFFFFLYVGEVFFFFCEFTVLTLFLIF